MSDFERPINWNITGKTREQHKIEKLEKEVEEQARLNGMGSEREARLQALVREHERLLIRCKQSVAFNLASWQKWMKKDGDYSKAKTEAVKIQIRELRELLNFIEELEKK